MPQHLPSSALCSLALGRMLLSLARRAMDEVLTKISLLLSPPPRSSSFSWKWGLEGKEDRTRRRRRRRSNGGGVCISHDESITAVNLTALRSLISRLHSRGKGYLYSNAFSCGKASTREGFLKMPHRLRKLEVALFQLGPSVQLANFLSR